ncbi:MAG: hypothetical protein JWM99_383 [Verrucomicrobiales bacterium]|nr:hypothetical protein [Verrucomicrobiales bacterium]
MRFRLEDQTVKKIKSFLLAFASLAVICSTQSSAATIAQDFSGDPFSDGWRISGDTNLFHWDKTNQNLQVTWDSSRPNSYFYHPLGTVLARDDDFSIGFDLFLNDIMSGNEPGKTGALEIGIGLFNFIGATRTNFMRGAFGGAPNVVEFDYFPAGYFEGFGDVAPTTTATFVSNNGFAYAPTMFTPYVLALPTNQTVHVSMNFTGSNQTLRLLVTTNSVSLAQFPDIVLTDPKSAAFTSSDDFRLDAFSISSYSSAGDDYDSVFAHGTIGNIVVTTPPLAIQNLKGSFSNSLWQVQFNGRTNWQYALERTVDLQSWSTISALTNGSIEITVLSETNSVSDKAFYRVRATRP